MESYAIAAATNQPRSPRRQGRQLQPDPNYIGSREEMLRLWAAQPPWCQENLKRWVVIDLEYYTLSGPYGKGEGDALSGPLDAGAWSSTCPSGKMPNTMPGGS